MKRILELLTYNNQPAYLPSKIDLPDFWGDSPQVGEVIELKGLLKPEDEKIALDYLFENGKVLKVKSVKSYIEHGEHVREFQMELA